MSEQVETIVPDASVTQSQNSNLEAINKMFEKFESKMNSNIETKIDSLKADIPTATTLQHSTQPVNPKFRMEDLADDPEKMAAFVRENVDMVKMRDDQFYRHKVEAFFNEIKEICTRNSVFSRDPNVQSLLSPDGKIRSDLESSVDVNLISNDKPHMLKMAYEFLNEAQGIKH